MTAHLEETVGDASDGASGGDDVKSGGVSGGAGDYSMDCDSLVDDASDGVAGGDDASCGASDGARDCSIGASRDGADGMVGDVSDGAPDGDDVVLVDDASGGAMDGDDATLGGASGVAGDCSMDFFLKRSLT